MPLLYLRRDRQPEILAKLDSVSTELSAAHDRLDVLSDFVRKLSYINTNLSNIYERMTKMQTALDALRDEVAALSDVPASIDAAFAGLKKQLADAIANAGDPAAVNAIVADLHAKADAIRAAITANTNA